MLLYGSPESCVVQLSLRCHVTKLLYPACKAGGLDYGAVLKMVTRGTLPKEMLL